MFDRSTGAFLASSGAAKPPKIKERRAKDIGFGTLKLIKVFALAV